MSMDRFGTVVHTHGYGGYTRGCRCDVCRAAKAEYVRDRRRRARQMAARFTDTSGRHLARGITHGTVSGYDENACRCQPCTSAMSAKWLAEYHRRKARAS